METHVFRATATLQQQTLVEAATERHKVIVDEPESLGGTDLAMNPVELVLSALGACQAIVAQLFARTQGVRYEKLQVEVEGDLNVGGMAGNPGMRPGFREVRYTVHITTDEPQHKIDEFLALVAQRCPVGDIIANATPVRALQPRITRPADKDVA